MADITTATVSWTERKQQLKKEIVGYFSQRKVSKEKIIKACQYVKDWGITHLEWNLGTGEDTPFQADEASDCFSPEHCNQVADWVNQYASLHKEALEHLEKQRNYGAKTNWARNDFELRDWEASQPKGEIQVERDRVRVFALGFTEGFTQSLPREGKKSIGQTEDGWEWEYPLSQLEALKKLGLPVLYAIV